MPRRTILLSSILAFSALSRCYTWHRFHSRAINYALHSNCCDRDLVDTQARLLKEHGQYASTALSFFKFVDIPGNLEVICECTRKEFQHIPNCLGTVYIAQEGVNSALHIPTRALVKTQEILQKTIPNLQGLEFNLGETRANWDVLPFKKLLVKPRRFVLTDGLPERYDWNDNGRALSPSEWHEELVEGQPVVIDCRNDYESDIGSFDDATALNTTIFSESWDRLDKLLKTTPKDSKIMTYCTGGIRCVKVNAYLKQKLGFNNIYRLSGGIISYENWAEGNNSRFKGKNYVFDDRRERFVKNYGVDDHKENGEETF